MADMAMPTRTIRKTPRPMKTLGKIVLYILVAIVSVLTIFPIYWMLVSTFQPSKYTLHYPPPLFPQEITAGLEQTFLWQHANQFRPSNPQTACRG